MRQGLLILGMLLSAGAANANVSRNDGQPDAGIDVYVQVVRVPADDIDKWFISVVTMQGCPACTKLKQDWARDPWLRALAVPDHPKQSWAHLNWYDKDDKSQAWRFEKVRITAYPTVLVQPPRNNKYGNPSTVVYQGTYGGDAHGLATAMTGAIRRYVEALPKPVQEVEQRPDLRPPFQPPPKVDPPVLPDARPFFPSDPMVPPPELRPNILPDRALMGDALLLLAGAGVPLLIGGVIFGLKYIRAQRVAAGKPLLLDDLTMEQLLKFLQFMQMLSEAKSRLPAKPEEPVKKAA